MSEISKTWYIQYSGILFCYKKEQSIDICNNMDELSKHQVKWKKYNFISMKCPE